MVVFTCNHCGETLHKPKVEKHYQFQCRNYKSVTCVDCFKDFKNEEYVVHTKCITEDERYAAKGTYKNGIVKKGEVKQESWVEMIKSICDTEKNLRPSLRDLLETISGYSNVPRKKVKFMNFIKSSSGNRANMKEVEEVWDIIEQHKSKRASNNQNNAKSGTEVHNGTAENNKSETIENGVCEKKRKSKADDQEQVNKKIEKQNPEKVIENNKSETNENGVCKKKRKSKADDQEQVNKKIEKQNPEKVIENNKSETNENGVCKEKRKSEADNQEQVYKKIEKQNPEKVIENNKSKTNENGVCKKKRNSKADNQEQVNKKIKKQDPEEVIENNELSKFNYQEHILKILSEKQSISLKKLQKKILKAYANTTGKDDCSEKVIKKFNKKLKKIPNISIEDEKVILKS